MTPRRWWRGALAAAALAAASGPAIAQFPPGFVYLADIDPSIVQDMRYAGADNFVGRKLPGYDAAECILRREVAQALAQVQADLAASRLGLKVYDCYRPQRAVRAMAQWAHDGAPDGRSKRFFPRVDKRALFALGYIASASRHSTGAAVDLTLVPLPVAPAAPFDPAATYGPCTGPAAARAPDNGLDMGTGFDCFDVASRTRSTDVGAEQRARRALLVAAMARRGFVNYFREWWHFALPASAPAYDAPIRPR
jgi:D-alanyl-D-alanine dipeptidase